MHIGSTPGLQLNAGASIHAPGKMHSDDDPDDAGDVDDPEIATAPGGHTFSSLSGEGSSARELQRGVVAVSK